MKNFSLLGACLSLNSPPKIPRVHESFNLIYEHILNKYSFYFILENFGAAITGNRWTRSRQQARSNRKLINGTVCGF